MEKNKKESIKAFYLIIFIMLIEGILIASLFYKINALNTELNNSVIPNSSLQTNNTNNEYLVLLDKINNLNNELSSLKSQVKLNLSTQSANSDYKDIITQSSKSLVTIYTDVALGSGFIITKDGYIATNAHVINNSKSIKVITYDNITHDVKLIGYDSKYDIALLKIDGDYPYLQFDNSDDVYLGERVIALGNPLGLTFSVTEGIISGVHRTDSNGLSDYLQTDAPLNPGNSGGPLLDTNGKVIGITNIKIRGSDNIGFALESNTIIDIINKISNTNLKMNLATISK